MSLVGDPDSGRLCLVVRKYIQCIYIIYNVLIIHISMSNLNKIGKRSPPLCSGTEGSTQHAIAKVDQDLKQCQARFGRNTG